jgi:putative hemolysin
VVGYLHIRDVANAYASDQRHLRASDLMRDVPFESERATVSRAFTTMRQTGAQLLILIDEYGATSGLVTLEDIMEEVVGQIVSESGPQGEDVSVRIGGLLHVEGQRSLGDLSEELGVEIRHADAETVGGLVTSILRRIPEVGETVEFAGYRFTVKGADGRRVSLVALEALPREVSGSVEAGEDGDGASKQP